MAFSPNCGTRTFKIRKCPNCGKETLAEKCEKCGHITLPAAKRNIDLQRLIQSALRRLRIRMPQLMKGVKGIINVETKFLVDALINGNGEGMFGVLTGTLSG